MTESASTSTLPSSSSESITHAQPLGLVAKYRLDHRNAVNHFLHVGVGWPMVAVAVLIVPFRPLWSLALFVSAYAIMFFGHFVFERNTPTVLKQPSTPFVIAVAVLRDLWRVLARLAKTDHAG
jgi:hypothetical protein